MKKFPWLLILATVTTNLQAQSSAENFRLVLHEDWKMQSAYSVSGNGNEISQKSFDVKNWYRVTVPSTIIAGLLANHVYDFDPFYGRNFEKLADKRLDSTWWFRKEFELPPAEKNKNVVLTIHGINYK